MFSEEQITKIFSNIEQIYLFHQEILRQLEECFVEDDPHASEIGAMFLNNVSFIVIIILGGWEVGETRKSRVRKVYGRRGKFSPLRSILRVAGTCRYPARPIAPPCQKIVIFEANYSRLLLVTETRLRHLL